jgi:large exoprotein involved in heme utilization and adhesion
VIATRAEGTGDGANIIIRAGSLRIINGAEVSTATEGSGQGGAIEVESDNLQILNSGVISVSTTSTGKSGDILIKADDILLAGQGNSALTGISSQTLSESHGGDGGSIRVESKNLQILSGSEITATTSGSGDGGNITINAEQTLINGNGAARNAEGISAFTGIITTTLGADNGGRGGSINAQSNSLSLLDGGSIASDTEGSGGGGNITIKTDSLLIDGQGNPATGISAATFAETNGGKAGQITIGQISMEGGTVQLRNGGIITTTTFGSGDGGDIEIKADTVILNGQGSTQDTSVTAETEAGVNRGNSGSISVVSKSLQVLNGAEISTSTFGDGQGGSVTINADSVLLNGQGNSKFTGINAATFSESSGGNGGQISLSGDRIQIINGAAVSAVTLGNGNAGTITVNADTLLIDRRQSSLFTGITGDTFAQTDGGRGGSIVIERGVLHLLNGGGIASSTDGSGDGGNIDVHSREVMLNQGFITSEARGSGNAGSITVESSGSINLVNESSIAVSSEISNGGAAIIRAGDSIFITGNSEISAQAGQDGGGLELQAGNLILAQDSLLNARAGGTGGNISSQARFVVLNRSTLNANAIRGNGGNISIRSDVFLPSIESRITASSEFAAPGTIAIESPNTNVGGSLVTLPANLLGAENYLQERCLVRRRGKSSSFTVNRRSGLPPDPSGLLPSVPVK